MQGIAARSKHPLRPPELGADGTMHTNGLASVPAIEVAPARLVPGEVKVAVRLPFRLEHRAAIAAGNARATEAGLSNLRFQEGDASNLEGLSDNCFDLVVTIFGAMFAPKPFDVAKEMVRVTKPGGRIVMGNWIPGDPTLVAQILRISSSYSPPPPEGFVSPMTWGVEGRVAERFSAAGVEPEYVTCVRETYTFNFPGSPTEFVAAFRGYYAPTMNAFDAAQKDGKAADLQRELEELFTAQNKSGQADATSIPATFLKVTAHRV